MLSWNTSAFLIYVGIACLFGVVTSNPSRTFIKNKSVSYVSSKRTESTVYHNEYFYSSVSTNFFLVGEKVECSGCSKNYTCQHCGGHSCDENQDLDDLAAALVFGMVITLGVIIIGGIGNSLTIVTILHQWCLHPSYRHIPRMSSSIVLVMNLAIADLMYCLVSLPVVFYIYITIYTSNMDTIVPHIDSLCKVSAFVRYINAISEWSTIGLMALERFITIRRYSNFKRPSRCFTTKRTIFYCCSIWVIFSLLQLPTLLEFGGDFFAKFGYNCKTLKCDFVETTLPEDEPISFGIRECFFLLEAAIPCAAILFCYAAILTQIYSSGRLVSRFGTGHCRMRIAMRRSRTTKVYLRLIGVYLVCVIPICIWNISTKVECLGTTKNQILGIVLYCIYWLQYSINSAIYFFALPYYRKACVQFLSRMVCREIKPKMKPTIRKSVLPDHIYVIPNIIHWDVSIVNNVNKDSQHYKDDYMDSGADCTDSTSQGRAPQISVDLKKVSISSQWSFSQYSLRLSTSHEDIIPHNKRKLSCSLKLSSTTKKLLMFKRQISC